MKKVTTIGKSQMKGGERMKKALVLAAILTLVMAGAAFAGVQGTPHDLSGTYGGYICVACHTPHGAMASSNGPLWNKNQAAQTYTPYSTSTFDMSAAGIFGGGNAPGPQSLACLTCHNGVASTLVNEPGPTDGTYGAWTLTQSSNSHSLIGTDLSNDHPVGFTYDPTADQQNNGFPALNGNQIGTTGLYVYDNTNGSNQLECATCHDVHNQSVTTRAPVYFMRINNANSALCAACHTTKI